MPLLLTAKYRSEVVVELLLARDNVNLDLKSAFRNILLL